MNFKRLKLFDVICNSLEGLSVKVNFFWQVDKGFVAQVADVANGRSAPMNEEQRKEAEKTIVGEFSNVKHVRGTLSMGR